MIWNRNCLKVLIICCFYICTSSLKKSYKNYKLLELEGQKSNVMKVIEYINAIDEFATYELGQKKAQVLLQPNLVTRFMNFATKMHVQVKVIVSDYSKLLEKETKRTLRDRGNFSWIDYYSVEDIHKYLITMQEKYPLWSTLLVAGESYWGRKIMGLRVFTNVPLPRSQPKPVIVIEGGAHAREWMTPAVTTYFINKLLTNNSDNFKVLRNSFDWHIFPILNPDGYYYSLTNERMWRKSRSRSNKTKCIGVDLNRNWNYNFGMFGSSRNPCSYQIYAGSEAFSEIETRSMASYISKLNNILAFIAIHTYASAIMVPYSDTNSRIQNYSQLEKMARSANEYSGIRCSFGNAEKVLGDKVSGSSMDWVYSVKEPPITFTFELRGSTFFAPSRDIPKQGEEVSNMIIGLLVEAKRQDLYQQALPYD